MTLPTFSWKKKKIKEITMFHPTNCNHLFIVQWNDDMLLPCAKQQPFHHSTLSTWLMVSLYITIFNCCFSLVDKPSCNSLLLSKSFRAILVLVFNKACRYWYFVMSFGFILFYNISVRNVYELQTEKRRCACLFFQFSFDGKNLFNLLIQTCWII